MLKPALKRFYFQGLFPAILAVVLFVVFITAGLIPVMKKQLMNKKKEMIKELCYSAISIIDHFYHEQQKGILTEQEAKMQALQIIHDMRYGPELKDYFWINDTQPVMVMHPYIPYLDGQNLSNIVDSQGNHLFDSFVIIAQNQGEGYEEYYWQWKDDASQKVQKISFVKLFQPWQWIVGTGVYLIDIQQEVVALKLKIGIYSFVITLIIAIILFSVLRRSLINELEREKAMNKITELNALLERNIGERNMKIKEVNNELEAFAYTISHDLRAPIRHIDGFSKLLFSKLNNPEGEIVNYHKKVIESTTKMTRLIDELLAFSQSGRKEVTLELIDMNKLIQLVINDLSTLIDCKSTYWVVSQLPSVFGDYNLLKQAFHNLLMNAVKFTQPKGTAQIEIGANESLDYIEYLVKDNGVGFNMQYIHKLFGVFQRLHSTDEFDGVGIGLAYVKQITIKHNGEVRAESELGKGSIFYIKLPKRKNQIN